MVSITFESCEVKENTEAAKKFVDEMNDLLGGLGSGSCLSLDEAERHISEGIRSLEQRLLEMHVSEKAAAKETEPVVCPECEQICRVWRKRSFQITTLCGVIRVDRWVYRCASNHYHTPWDTQQKLKENIRIVLLK